MGEESEDDYRRRLSARLENRPSGYRLDLPAEWPVSARVEQCDHGGVFVMWADDGGSRNYNSTYASEVVGAHGKCCGAYIPLGMEPSELAPPIGAEG